MSDTTNSVSIEASAAQTKSVAASIFAIFLGVFLIIGAGFSHSEIMHNAAHDARHAHAFPCH